MIIMIIMMTEYLYIDMQSEPYYGPGTPHLHSVLNLLVVMESEQYPAPMQVVYAMLLIVEMISKC
jgi:hypothetical protein